MISILVFDIETPDCTEIICSLLVVTISDVVCDDVDISRDGETDDSDDIIDDVDISLDVKFLREVDVSDAVWDDVDVDKSREDSDDIIDGVDILADDIDVSDDVVNLSDVT